MRAFGDKFSYAIIGLAMEAHRELGPGLDELFYRELMAQKLKGAGIPPEVKPRRAMVHHGIVADEFEPDLVVTDELRRVAPEGFEDCATLSLLTDCLEAIVAEHGLGYRDTTYRGLAFAELSYRKVSCLREPVAGVCAADNRLGEMKLPCLVLPQRSALLITSLRESRQAADRAVLQTYLKHLDLPWGLHLNFGRERVEAQFVIKPRKSGR